MCVRNHTIRSVLPEFQLCVVSLRPNSEQYFQWVLFETNINKKGQFVYSIKADTLSCAIKRDPPNVRGRDVDRENVGQSNKMISRLHALVGTKHRLHIRCA